MFLVFCGRCSIFSETLGNYTTKEKISFDRGWCGKNEELKICLSRGAR